MKICYFKSPTFRGWDFFQHPRAIAISWLEHEGVIGLDRPGGGFKRWNPPGVAGKGNFLDFPPVLDTGLCCFPLFKGLDIEEGPQKHSTQALSGFTQPA